MQCETWWWFLSPLEETGKYNTNLGLGRSRLLLVELCSSKIASSCHPSCVTAGKIYGSKTTKDKAPSTYFSRPNNALVLVITLNISFFGLPSLLTFCDKNPFSTLLERKSYWTEEGFEREKERLRCCLLDLSVLSQAFQSVVLELWQKGKKILANRS